MIINILVFLWIVFIILLLSIIAKKMFNRSYVVPFQDYGKVDVPYITIDVQGTPFNFLVDTGCGVSIISKYFLDGINYSESKRKVDLMALTPDTLNGGMVTIPLTIKGKVITEDFVVYDKQDIANFQAHYGITIHGILGNEFLEKTGCKIDYKNHKVIVP